MICPNCSKDQPDAAAECGNCGFILSKWKAAQASAGSSAPVARAPERTGSGGQPWALVIVGALVVVGALYFLYGRGDADDSSDAGMTLGPGYCAFSGEVLDLYRLDPVKNAQLMLKPKGYARSDKAGRYYVKVKAGIPYHFTIAQPQFKPAFIEGSWRDAAFEQRVRASRLLEKADSDPSDKPYECSSGEERSLVLGLVPKAVTADEKKDIDAVP